MDPDTSRSRTNLEFKARVADHDALASAFSRHGAMPAGMLRQTDTYFSVARGRLKIREVVNGRTELIFYDRDESLTNHMESHYRLVDVNDPGLKIVLEAAMGIKIVVKKKRRLYLWKNARIHLDEVETLGKFLEFEVVSEPDLQNEVRNFEEDSKTLEALKEIAAPFVEQEIACSYSDLMLSGKPDSAA